MPVLPKCGTMPGFLTRMVYAMLTICMVKPINVVPVPTQAQFVGG